MTGGRDRRRLDAGTALPPATSGGDGVIMAPPSGGRGFATPGRMGRTIRREQ
jgi:hypothetical protein